MSRTTTGTAASVVVMLLAQSILAPLAMAQSFQSPLDNEPRVMFYLSKGFGDSRKPESAPQLGLRFEKTYRFETRPSVFEPVQRPALSQSLMDLRWTGGYGRSLHFFGAPVYRTPQQLNSSDIKGGGLKSDSLNDIGESSGGYGWTVLIALVGIAALCAAEVGICESSSYNRGRETDTAPDNGT